jgi:GTPase involved in cell partitioning and DNA repair
MLLIDQFKKFKPELLLELPYEEMTEDPDPGLKIILDFVNEDSTLLKSQKNKTHKEKNKYKEKLSKQEIQIIIDKCEPFYSQYGYGDNKKKVSKSLFKKLFN